MQTGEPEGQSQTPGTIDELAGFCFGCGPRNFVGLHLEFAVDGELLTATAPVLLGKLYEGAPGYLHGGIIATLMDEAMSKLSRPLGVLAMTRHMEVDYLRPAAIDTVLTITSTHLRREGRKLFQQAELRDEAGTVLARAKGLFVVLRDEDARRLIRGSTDEMP